MVLLGLLLAATAPVDTTIAELRANPQAFAGKIVRLHGQVDQCWNFSCNLCPEAMTSAVADAKACLALNFDDALIPGHLSDDAFRFSQVTLTARFDPACITREVLCLDRATVLTDARVEKVARRYTSSEGLWTIGRRRSMLAPLPEGEAAEVIAATARFRGGLSGYATRVFRTDGDAERALVCTVADHAARKPEAWPSSWDAAILSRSAIDIFECSRVKRIDGKWVFATS